MRTPLAWLSLIHDRQRLLSSLLGVGFAVLLMITEMGFLTAIYDSSTLVVEAFNADLLIVGQEKDDFNPSKPFPRARLSQARALPQVISAVPVWTSRLAAWSSSGQSRRDLIRLIAFDPDDVVFKADDIQQRQRLLRRVDTALVDRRYRDSYGGLAKGSRGELEGRQVQLVDDFELGPDLQLNVNLLVSDRTFELAFHKPDGSGSPLDRVEFGLVRITPESSVEAVARQLRRRLPTDVRVMTPAQFQRQVHGFWTRHQPVGAVFGLGLLVGFLVGLVICYQILFTEVVDHLPQFATLKAIGFRNSYLIRLAAGRGLWLGVLVLVLFLPAGFVIYALLSNLTALTFRLTWIRAALIVATTLSLCVAASILAMVKALKLDPAEVF